MNSKKAVLFVILSIFAVPAVSNAGPSKDHAATSPVKHVSLGVFTRIFSLGHKKQPVVTDAHGNRKDFKNKTH